MHVHTRTAFQVSVSDSSPHRCRRSFCLPQGDFQAKSSTRTSKVPNIIAQYPTVREYRQCQYWVNYFGAILPKHSVFGYWAVSLGIVEIQVDAMCAWGSKSMLEVVLRMNYSPD